MSVAMTSMIVDWLRSGRLPTARTLPNGEYELTTTRRCTAALLVCFVVISSSLPFLVIATAGDLTAQLLSGGLGALLWLAVAWGLWDAVMVRILVSPFGLMRKSRLGWSRTIPWNSVSEMSYSKELGIFRFRASHGASIRISAYRNGLATLVKVAKGNLGNAPGANQLWIVESHARNP